MDRRRNRAGILIAGSAGAQDRYPSQSIKFVVPFAAGSATDTLARLLGNRISASLGQTVVVENIAGGSGIIAAHNVAALRAGRLHGAYHLQHHACVEPEHAQESAL